MPFKTVFKRYELKYMITVSQKEKILREIKKYIRPDKYGKTTIRNIYFDTPDYRLIRRSIEKPDYKEKLRIRAYSTVENNDTVFVELKKKYEKIVYKRRVALPQNKAMQWLEGKKPVADKTQVIREIDYFLKYYKSLRPTLFLCYDREAYFTRDKSDFRLTFDSNIRCRENKLSLCEKEGGIEMLPEEKVLMEIKCSGSIPLWMTEILSREKIYKTPFSKYGTAYSTIIFPKLKESKFNVK